MLTEPLVTDSVQKGLVSILYTAGALRPGTYLSVLQYSPEFAHNSSDVATRFMQAYLQGVRDYYDAFQERFPGVRLQRGKRFVRSDARIFTAGGLTSGIDLALHVVDLYFGGDVARRTAKYMEYDGTGWLRAD